MKLQKRQIEGKAPTLTLLASKKIETEKKDLDSDFFLNGQIFLNWSTISGRLNNLNAINLNSVNN